MKLAEWCKVNDVLPTHPTTERGAVSLIPDKQKTKEYAELFHLDDYVVSSVCGVVVWLVPKPQDAKTGEQDERITNQPDGIDIGGEG